MGEEAYKDGTSEPANRYPRQAVPVYCSTALCGGKMYGPMPPVSELAQQEVVNQGSDGQQFKGVLKKPQFWKFYVLMG